VVGIALYVPERATAKSKTMVMNENALYHGFVAKVVGPQQAF
jgi:hypothetical protein